jgi:hypothetical protein
MPDALDGLKARVKTRWQARMPDALDGLKARVEPAGGHWRALMGGGLTGGVFFDRIRVWVCLKRRNRFMTG